MSRISILAPVLLFITVCLLAPSSLWGFESVDKALREGTTLSPDEVSELNPTTAEQHAKLARVLNEPEASATHYRRALDLDPPPSVGRELFREYLNLLVIMDGDLNQDTGFLEDVSRELEEEFSKEDWIQLARFYRMSEHYELARETYQQVLIRFDSTPRSLLGLAELALVREQFDEAEQRLNQYVRNEPTTPAYWYLKGQLHERQDRPEEARLAYQQITDFYSGSLVRSLLDGETDGGFTGDGEGPERPGEPGEDGVTPHRVQLGSFQDPSQARSFREDIAQNYDRPVTIQETTVDGTRFYRVQISGFTTETEAEQFLERLQGNGQDGYYLRVDSS